MTRAKLFYLRMSATLGLLAVLLLIVRQLWYPGGYFPLFGVGKLVLVTVAAVIIVGPILSAAVYRPGKKGLKFDLIILATLELAIIAWAAGELAERRPVYAVFAVDRFEAVAAREVDLSQLRYAELANWPATSPRLVYAELPTDPDVMNQLIDDTVFLGRADIDRRPEFWKPYPQGIATLKQVAIPLRALLAAGDARATYIRRWLRGQALTEDSLSYLPVRGSKTDGIMVLHADIAYPVDVVPIDPW